MAIYKLPLIKDIMTKNVITVGPNNTMNEVSVLFDKHNIHHLPVIDEENKLVGMISKSDYLLLTERVTFFRKEFGEQKNERFFSSLLVEDVMIKKLATIQEGDSVMLAVGMLKTNLFHALPVVNETDELVGILTTYDLLTNAYEKWLPAKPVLD